MPLLTALSVVLSGIIAYTYVGYPAAAWALARRRSPRSHDPKYLPKVSLIIAAYDEEKAIAAKLEESLALDYPSDRLEILVAADGSTDRTVDIVRSFADRGVRLSFEPARRGKASAIDRAVLVANGEILVFSYANNRYADGTVRALVAPFVDPMVGMVSGAKRTEGGLRGLGAGEGVYWKYENFIKTQQDRLGSCTAASGEVMALRAGIVGPLDEGVVLDDLGRLLQVLEAGYEVRYAPAAVSTEPTMATVQAELNRRQRSTAGRWLVVEGLLTKRPKLGPLVWWQFISHKVLRLVLPFAMISLFLTAGLDLLRRGRVGRAGWAVSSLFGGQLLFYAVALIGRRLPLGGRAKLLYVPRYLVETNLATLAGARRALTGSDIELWDRVARFGEVDLSDRYQPSATSNREN